MLLRQHNILINGTSVSAEGVSAQTTLLDFLRDAGLTGAKELHPARVSAAMAPASLRTSCVCDAGHGFKGLPSSSNTCEPT